MKQLHTEYTAKTKCGNLACRGLTIITFVKLLFLLFLNPSKIFSYPASPMPNFALKSDIHEWPSSGLQNPASTLMRDSYVIGHCILISSSTRITKIALKIPWTTLTSLWMLATHSKIANAHLQWIRPLF